MSNTRTISDWFDSYSDDIYQFLVYYLGTSDVEDIVQEVFIKAIDKFHTYNKQAKPKTWLFSIARNVAIDELRKRKRLDWKRFLKFKEMLEDKDLNTPDEILEMKEMKAYINKLIQALKPHYRDVIYFRAIKELSVKETASILNWSENKVRVTYYRALKVLQQKKGGNIHEHAKS